MPGVGCNNCLLNVISTNENFVEKHFFYKAMELSSNLCGIAGVKYRIPYEGFPNLHQNSGLVGGKEVCACGKCSKCIMMINKNVSCLVEHVPLGSAK